MKNILTLDDKNYDINLEKIKRTAVRAIIFLGDNLLMVENDNHEVKFPGGGVEMNETETNALTREVLEETGYKVVKDSIKAFGSVEEIRLSSSKDKIWNQTNKYYFCKVEDTQTSPNYSLAEKELNFNVIYISIDDAIKRNERYQKINTINKREYEVLKLLKEYMK